MNIKLLNLLPALIANGVIFCGATDATPESNSLDSLIQSTPMMVALFYENTPGELDAPFTAVSKTPRFRFSQLQFIKASRSQTGVDDTIAKNGIAVQDLPIIVLFRDGTIITDEAGKIVGLMGTTTENELRDFIDDYFSDQIQGVLKYSKEHGQQFDHRPSDEVLYADYSDSYQPAANYEPIVYTPLIAAWQQPIWWRDFYSSSYYYPYWRGYRPYYYDSFRPPWYRHNRPHRWDDRREHRHERRHERRGEGHRVTHHERRETRRYDASQRDTPSHRQSSLRDQQSIRSTATRGFSSRLRADAPSSQRFEPSGRSFGRDTALSRGPNRSIFGGNAQGNQAMRSSRFSSRGRSSRSGGGRGGRSGRGRRR